MAKIRTLNLLQDSIHSSLQENLDLESISVEDYKSKFMEVFEQVKGDCEESSLSTYHATAPKMLKQSRKMTRGFETRNFKRWKPAFDHIEMMTVIAQELGETHGKEIQAAGDKSNDAVMAGLSHLFPRALLVTQEIICLLKGGFPDGALARWRSLHEISVTAMYIAKHGESAAKAYLLSFHFASRRAAHQINEHSERANMQPFSKDELQVFDLMCQEAEKHLGRKIDKDKLGEWPAITKTHPSFADIEKDVGMDHWRPRYKWASTNIHANHRLRDKLLGMSETMDDGI